MALGLTNAAMKVVPGQMTLPYLIPQGNVLQTPQEGTPQIANTTPPAQQPANPVTSTTQQSSASEQPLNAQNEGVQNASVGEGFQAPLPRYKPYGYKYTGTPADDVYEKAHELYRRAYKEQARKGSLLDTQQPAQPVTQKPSSVVEQPTTQNSQQPAAPAVTETPAPTQQQPTEQPAQQPTEAPTDQPTNNGPRKLDINDFLSGDGDLGEFLQSYIKEEKEKQQDYKEQEKRFKREKIYNSIGDAISALSNVFFATKGAPNMFDPKNSMTAKAQERYDKMIADRDKGRDNLIRLSTLREQLRQNDNNTRLTIEQFNQQSEQNAWNRDMQQKQYDDNKENAAWQKQMEQDKFGYQKEKDEWQKDLAEKQLSMEEKRLGMSYAQFNASLQMEREKLALEKQKGSVVFALGNGETIDIPTNALNNQTVGYLFSLLPKEVRSNVLGKPMLTKDPNTGQSIPVMGSDAQPMFYPPDSDDMIAAVGAYLSNAGPESRAVRTQIKKIAGQTQTVRFGVPSSSKSSSSSSGDDLGVM